MEGFGPFWSPDETTGLKCHLVVYAKADFSQSVRKSGREGGREACVPFHFFVSIFRRLDAEQTESLINQVPEEESDQEISRDKIEA